MGRKVIVTCAVVGEFNYRTQNPNIPYTPEELALDAKACREAGAAVIHFHARKMDGTLGGGPEIWKEIHERVTASTDVLLNFTTGSTVGASPEDRIKSLDLRPDIGGLVMGPLTFTGPKGESHYLDMDRQKIEWFAREMLDRGVKPELETFSFTMLQEVQNLIDKKLLEPPYLIDFVLGVKAMGALAATPENLIGLMERAPNDSIINVTAMRESQLQITTLGLLLGAHARTGLEDNLFLNYEEGELATNRQLVERTVRILQELQMEPATPGEAREILGIKPLTNSGATKTSRPHAQ
jgi:3-keto-5-aminohexanoate cleavage enzyme